MNVITKIYIGLADAIVLLEGIDDQYIEEFIRPKIKQTGKEVDKKRKVHDIPFSSQWVEHGVIDQRFKYAGGMGITKWPSKTSLLCWYCTRPISGPPVGLPYRKSKVNSMETYNTVGCFCSFSCAFTWNKKLNTLCPKHDTEAHLYDLYYAAGYRGKIRLAPMKELLLKYGGQLTNDEYGQYLGSNTNINLCMTPMISNAPIFDVTDVDKIVDDKKEGKYRVYRKGPTLYSSVNHFFE